MGKYKAILGRLGLTTMVMALTSTAAFALSPPNITSNIKWNTTYNGIADIATAFNNARRQEEIQLGLPVNKLGSLALPAQSTWTAMSDDAKALFLINAERTARNGMLPGVLGLPLAGVESHVDSTSKAYAELLVSTNKFGHYEPSGNSTVDNPPNRIKAKVKAACVEFLTRSENLAYFAVSSTKPLTEANIPLPIERSIYNWLYDDAGSQWGHREAILLQNSPLSQPSQTTWGYKNNNGIAANEGYLGFYKLGSSAYYPGGTSAYPYKYGVLTVMNIFDPVSDSAASTNTCGYTVTAK